MIPRIYKATLIGDMWLVWVNHDEFLSLPSTRLVPTTETPISCPGGIWCETVHPGEPY